MWDHALPALYAAFVWWFSTGVILLLVGRPRRTYRWSMAVATVLLFAALAGITLAGGMTDASGAYLGFTCAILVWGWLEMAFLMGFVTGRRPRPQQGGRQGAVGGWRHFFDAVAAIIDHELSIIAGAAVVIGLTWAAPNQIATWTFLALWGMRQSAKLNLFFGVRNLNDELLPPHLRHLRAFLRRRPMNPLFPLSIIVGTAVCALVAAGAVAPTAGELEMIGLTLVGALLALGVFEHWMMILPLPVNALWRWSLRNRAGGVGGAPVRPAAEPVLVQVPARSGPRFASPAWPAARRRARSSASTLAGRARRSSHAPWRP